MVAATNVLHTPQLIFTSLSIELYADAADSGVYTCQVTNPGGRLYREVEVVVEVPPRLTLLPRTAEVTQGERFVVECEAVGVSVPSISWLLNAVEVS
ncbi:hypothetical protein Pcinc_007418 [Petrolisthes cinctipes]|uniref:Ig-like domain-containing protein n=1 Tax=Petrolisthes cinctipes TaxID=88211 RepID=A0AAE1GAY0_PETCI|nr:hypothetical protein Pcinc_007418 [Petrolisthes cinctipes]